MADDAGRSVGYAATVSDPVDAYLAELPEPHRRLLAHVRDVIHDTQPGLVERISYGMPAFALDGKNIVWFASFKRHCSLYPANPHVQEALGAALAPFVGEKATIRFTPDRPIPDELVRRLVEVRAAEVAGKG